MSGVARLPVQHPEHPHCPFCDADLPEFRYASVSTSVSDVGGYELLGISFHILCKCGQPLDLRRDVKQ